MSRPVLAASAACFRSGQVLIAQRANPPRLWSLPGGRVHFGEAAAEAARRELLEETGVRAEILGFAGYREAMLHEGDTLTRHFVILAFAARWQAGEATPGPEANAVTWIEPGALSGYQTTDGLAEIVKAARRIVDG